MAVINSFVNVIAGATVLLGGESFMDNRVGDSSWTVRKLIGLPLLTVGGVGVVVGYLRNRRVRGKRNDAETFEAETSRFNEKLWRKEYTTEGDYVDLMEIKKGTGRGLVLLRNRNGIVDGPSYWDSSPPAIEWIEDILGNSDWELITADQLGALSEAPVLAKGHYDDEGNFVLNSNVAYYFGNYQIEDWGEVLDREGEVFFHRASFSKAAESFAAEEWWEEYRDELEAVDKSSLDDMELMIWNDDIVKKHGKAKMMQIIINTGEYSTQLSPQLAKIARKQEEGRGEWDNDIGYDPESFSADEQGDTWNLSIASKTDAAKNGRQPYCNACDRGLQGSSKVYINESNNVVECAECYNELYGAETFEADSLARLTPLQQRSYDLIAKGYGYIECDPRGYKGHKARQINALIKKGLIEAWDSGGIKENTDTRKLKSYVDDWWVGFACLKGEEHDNEPEDWSGAETFAVDVIHRKDGIEVGDNSMANEYQCGECDSVYDDSSDATICCKCPSCDEPIHEGDCIKYAETFEAFDIYGDDEVKTIIENRCDGCGKHFSLTTNPNLIGYERAGAIVYENVDGEDVYYPTYNSYNDLLCKSCHVAYVEDEKYGAEDFGAEHRILNYVDDGDGQMIITIQMTDDEATIDNAKEIIDILVDKSWENWEEHTEAGEGDKEITIYFEDMGGNTLRTFGYHVKGNKANDTIVDWFSDYDYPVGGYTADAETFNRWSKDEMNEELHGGRDMGFDDWLEDEINSHGNIPLREWGYEEEHDEPEHQHKQKR